LLTTVVQNAEAKNASALAEQNESGLEFRRQAQSAYVRAPMSFDPLHPGSAPPVRAEGRFIDKRQVRKCRTRDLRWIAMLSYKTATDLEW
jgi:hypothetical protein